MTGRKHYILTPLGRTAVRTVRSDATVETRYFHQDALGSIYAVTNEAGKVEKRFTFDAWGKRVNTEDTHAGAGGKVPRGFTDHEMLEDFGLVHMNGRVYDPVLGRFMSADPFVDDAGDSQAFNRYTYCGNNPLLFTDPSGYFKLKDIFKIGAAIFVGLFIAPAEPIQRGQALGFGVDGWARTPWLVRARARATGPNASTGPRTGCSRRSRPDRPPAPRRSRI